MGFTPICTSSPAASFDGTPAPKQQEAPNVEVVEAVEAEGLRWIHIMRATDPDGYVLAIAQAEPAP